VSIGGPHKRCKSKFRQGPTSRTPPCPTELPQSWPCVFSF
jgi:hypothetical protein